MPLVQIHRILVAAKFSREFMVPLYYLPVITEAWRDQLPRGEADITIEPTAFGSERDVRGEMAAMKRDFSQAVARIYPTENSLARHFSDEVAEGRKWRFVDLTTTGDIKPITPVDTSTSVPANVAGKIKVA